jgi:hypothetical protein
VREINMADSKPDLNAVGNAATAKKTPSGALKLKSFSVDFSDNGGATVREIRERKVPEGRRAGSGFPMSSDVKENTFEDMARARAHIASLMTSPDAPAKPAPPAPPRPPAAAAVVRPPVGPPAAAAVRLPPRPMPQPMPPMGGGPGGPGGPFGG